MMREEIGDDTPLSLQEAAAGPLRGLVSASTLRAAIAAGTLPAVRLGKRYVVTRADLATWRAACRVQPKGHTSTSGSSSTPGRCGSSGTVDTSTAQASLEMTLNRLMTPASKQPSGDTSRPSTRPERSAHVTPIRSR